MPTARTRVPAATISSVTSSSVTPRQINAESLRTTSVNRNAGFGFVTATAVVERAPFENPELDVPSRFPPQPAKTRQAQTSGSTLPNRRLACRMNVPRILQMIRRINSAYPYDESKVGLLGRLLTMSLRTPPQKKGINSVHAGAKRSAAPDHPESRA
jgi:hypothetical protein